MKRRRGVAVDPGQVAAPGRQPRHQRVHELARPTLAAGESYADLLIDPNLAAFDADKAGEAGYAFVALNQLALEHLVGAR